MSDDRQWDDAMYEPEEEEGTNGVTYPTEPDVVPQITLDDLLPTHCVIIALDDGDVEPTVSTRGKYRNLKELLALIEYEGARIKYSMFLQDRA